MGVTHPKQIASYSLSSLDHNDYLRIVYTRPKNSFLPVIRTYRFPRIQQDVEGKGPDKVRMTTNPALLDALDELKQIVKARTDQGDIAAALLEELRQLEEEVALHAETLRGLISKIDVK